MVLFDSENNAVMVSKVILILLFLKTSQFVHTSPSIFAHVLERTMKILIGDVEAHLHKVLKFIFWLRYMIFPMFFSISNPVGTILSRSIRYNVKMLAT